jgi:hypothetical protein
MTRSSIRHAVFERCPADREELIAAVAEAMPADEAVIDDTLDYLERTGAVYVVDDEVRETGGGEA